MSLRRPLVAIAVVAALVGGAAGCGGRKEAPRAAQDAPQLTGVDPASDEVPATPSPTASATPTPGIQFPEVQPAIGEKMGEIEIPKIGLVHAVYQGFELTQIDNGPGHWPRSPLPGQPGNVVFAGHRVTHSRPFFDIDKLTPGDLIIFRTPSGEFTYEMTEQLIVRPTDVHILNPTLEATVTLFACHPKFSARQRYVVKGKMVSSTPAPVPDDDGDDD